MEVDGRPSGIPESLQMLTEGLPTTQKVHGRFLSYRKLMEADDWSAGRTDT